MRVIEKTARVEPQAIDGCSNELHMWWHDGCNVGDTLVLGFNAPHAGRYRIITRLVKARDYGTVRMAINGADVGEPIDLTAGENRISAEIVGANDKAVKSFLFGLDYIRLEPAP